LANTRKGENSKINDEKINKGHTKQKKLKILDKLLLKERESTKMNYDDEQEEFLVIEQKKILSESKSTRIE